MIGTQPTALIERPVDNAINQLYLYGVTTQQEFQAYVRAECYPDDVARLPELLQQWKGAAAHFRTIADSEASLPDGAKTREIGEAAKQMLPEILEDHLFQKTFSQLPITFKLVEIDNLIACQRQVNWDYVQALRAKVTSAATDSGLVELCLSPRVENPTPAFLQQSPNAGVYTSPSGDFRFLGGYPKDLCEDDFRVAAGGGLPVAAIVLLFGHGGSPVNVLASGSRLILNNGFHRAYALRSLGYDFMPAVVQEVSNADLELGPTIQGLPKDYLLEDPRPSMVKDFFDEQLIIRLRVKSRLKTLKVAWGVDQFHVPT